MTTPAKRPSFFTQISLRRITLFKRLPSLRLKLQDDQHIIPIEEQAQYQSFANDFALLEQHLMGDFRKLDNDALRWQNKFRLYQVILILGGAAVTVLGVIQATTHNNLWWGLIEAVLAIGLAIIAQTAQNSKAQERYFSNRLKAETLRSEYFTFLRHTAPYKDDQSRVQHLRQRVFKIKTSNERQASPFNLKEPDDTEQQALSSLSESEQQFWKFYQQHRFTNQLEFYEARQAEFGKAQNQATNLHSLLMALAGVVSVIGSANVLPPPALWSILAVVFPVLATALSTYDSLYAFERVAKLYEDAAKALRYVDLYHSLGTGPSGSINDFAERVEDILSAEQKQWGQLTSEIKGATPPGTNPQVGEGGD